jgi:hypothetical protein
MLMWLWWGLLGFLAVVLSVWLFVTSLGPKGRFVVVLIVGAVGGHLMDRWLTSDERAAKGFVKAWADESAGWPDGRMENHAFGEFLDHKRSKTVSPYLATRFRLLSYTPVRSLGKESIQPERAASPVRTKAFASDVRVHNSEGDVDFKATLKVWVAMDNSRVVDFLFEGIRFQ